MFKLVACWGGTDSPVAWRLLLLLGSWLWFVLWRFQQDLQGRHLVLHQGGGGLREAALKQLLQTARQRRLQRTQRLFTHVLENIFQFPTFDIKVFLRNIFLQSEEMTCSENAAV